MIPDLLFTPVDPLRDYKEKHPHSLNILDLPDHLFNALENQRQYEDLQAEDITVEFESLEQEQMYDVINQDVESWAMDSDKRRKVERQIAAYIRGKVAPLGAIHNANEIADKLDSCRLKGVVGVHPEGKKIFKWQYKCGLNKLCPDEAKSEQQRLAKRYVPAVEKWLDGNRRRTFQYAVLTIPNPAPGELYEAIRDIYKRFADLMKRKACQAVKGCLVTLEDPLSQVYSEDGELLPDQYSWNVHLNVMLLIDGHFDWKEFQQLWGYGIHFQSARDMAELARRRGRDTDRRTVLLSAFQELLKYSVKHLTGDGGKTKTVDGQQRVSIGMVEWPAWRFVEWWQAHRAYRRTRSYGVLFRIEDERERLDMSLVRWIGTVGYDTRANHYSVSLNPARSIFLIKENNSIFLNHQKRANYRNNSPGEFAP